MSGGDALRFDPDLAAERAMRFSGPWADSVCLWLGRRLGNAGALSWPAVLIPEVIDERLALPEQSVQIYHAVSWEDVVPRDEFIVGAGVAWISQRADTSEVAVRSYARIGEEPVAQSLIVARATSGLATRGVRHLPPVPDVVGLVRRRSFVVSEADIEAFVAVAGTRYRVASDLRYAREHEYPNVLVPGPLLLVLQLHFAGLECSGGIEVWFRRPVPVGCVLEACESEDNPHLWVFRPVGASDPVTVARLVN
jgi:hypothetical protein